MGLLTKKLSKWLNLSSESNRGFTLIELLVAVAIFVSALTIVSTFFVSALRAQRRSLAYQELLDQTSYLMEYMSRAIRMAKKDDIEIIVGGKRVVNNCLIGLKVNFGFDGGCLRFRNYRNECQHFCLVGGRLKEFRNGVGNHLSGPALRVNAFGVTLRGETQADFLQPLVSIFLDITGREESRIRIQTNISQRDLDVRR